jgi:hypothetical protein
VNEVLKFAGIAQKQIERNWLKARNIGFGIFGKKCYEIILLNNMTINSSKIEGNVGIKICPSLFWIRSYSRKHEKERGSLYSFFDASLRGRMAGK